MTFFFQHKRYSNGRGFTLIELLVVIAIIGMLSSVVLASFSSAREKSRDTRRIADLVQIRNAMHLYYDNNKNFIQSGSGCGYSGNGNGWFNYVGGIYPKSTSQCLVDDGIIPVEIMDPTGDKTSTPTNKYSYMKYSCNGEETYIYAKLENEPQSTTATDSTCCPNCDSSYGMNYYLQI